MCIRDSRQIAQIHHMYLIVIVEQEGHKAVGIGILDDQDAAGLLPLRSRANPALNHGIAVVSTEEGGIFIPLLELFQVVIAVLLLAVDGHAGIGDCVIGDGIRRSTHLLGLAEVGAVEVLHRIALQLLQGDRFLPQLLHDCLLYTS